MCLQCRRPWFDSWVGKFPGEGIGYPLQYSWASLVVKTLRNLPAMRETWAQSLGWEDPLEEGMETPVFLPGDSPFAEESGELQFMGSKRVWYDWAHTHVYICVCICIHTHTHTSFIKESVFKHPLCWEGLGAGGEGDDRGWDGWMASLTQRAGVWVNSGSWWWTGRPGVLWFMGLQRVGHDWVTELMLNNLLISVRKTHF